MSSGRASEEVVEEAVLAWFQDCGYAVHSGSEVSPQGDFPMRESYETPVLAARLLSAMTRINGHLPSEAIQDAVRSVLRVPNPTLLQSNMWFHNLLLNGVDVEYRTSKGDVRGGKAWIVSFDRPDQNDYLVVNQLLVKSGNSVRRPDLVVYLNGLPIAVIELKDPGNPDADIWKAYRQLQDYKVHVPALFVYNELLVISDGDSTRLGTLTSSEDRFSPWRSIRDQRAPGESHLEVLVRELFRPDQLLPYLQRCILIEANERTGEIVKKSAGYHQFRAMKAAQVAISSALKPLGDGRAGVVWHTQGSGKSLTMLMLAGALVQDYGLANPTIVVVTDRNDLDGQLFSTFAGGRSLLRQDPEQASSRADLSARLDRGSGGVIFTTIQKFEERGAAVTNRNNVIVLADEAHRSQYGFLEGGARWMREALPNATFVGFTGTPLELDDRSTAAVFGEYIDTYDIRQAVVDGATVPIYYEMRLVRLIPDEAGIDQAEAVFRSAIEADERGALLPSDIEIPLEELVGSEVRLKQVAREVVEHFEKRRDAIEGKAMVVCMSRAICMDLYDQIVAIRPEWHHEDDEDGFVKVVMTGSAAEGVRIGKHARTSARRNTLARRFRNPDQDFRLAIVCDMWLTGFDCPPLHTMYLDKPLAGHNLMQTIARVNRVFGDKPGGVIVDFLGIADQLREAVQSYTAAGGEGTPVEQVQAEAAPLMLREFESLQSFFNGFDYQDFFAGSWERQLRAVTGGVDYVLGQDDGRRRFVGMVGSLSKTYALVVPLEAAEEVRDPLIYFQAVRAAMQKRLSNEGQPPQPDSRAAVRQVLSGAISAGGVIDLFEAAGLKDHDVAVLSDDFLDRVGVLPHKNLALETLRKLLNDQILIRERVNLVQSRSFRDSLEEVLKRYTNRAISTAQVVDELIQLARLIRESVRRGEQSGLTQEELAFYDALADNESARDALRDDTLRLLARELAERIKARTSLDWTQRESVRADMRRTVRRLLARYGYPPDSQEAATHLVIRQAEVMAEGVSSA